MKKKNIVLIGMSGVGKSTIGKELSKSLSKKFIDLDSIIAKNSNQNLQSLLNTLGDKEFIKLEEQVCLSLNFDNIVCAPGGSLIYSKKAIEYCKQHAILIYLEDTYENIIKRIPNIQDRGIVGLLSESYEDIFLERQPLYEKYQDVTISCTNKSWLTITKEIEAYLTKDT